MGAVAHAKREARKPDGRSGAAAPVVLSAFGGRETAALEQEADRAAEQAARADGGGLAFRPGAAAAASGVQPKCDCSGPCECDKQEGLQRQVGGGFLSGLGGLVSTAAGMLGAAVAPTIVEDGAEAGDGQIQKSAFLARARAAITSAGDEELAPVGRSTASCPYIDFWWGRFRGYSAARMERAVLLFAQPGQRSVEAYVGAMAAATRQRVRQWIASGTATVPEDLDALSAVGGGDGQATAQAKAEPGRGGGGTSVPDEILSRLGAGQALDVGARSRMERGFGKSFGDVRIHTDSAASRVAGERGALALTVGSNILFRAGQYQPGSMHGDALLAHELAHTIQQRGGGVIGGASEAHESDADQAAAGAMAAAHGMGGAAAHAPAATGVGVQACTPTRKRCPPGMMWGNTAHQSGTVGGGSFGCACTYRCVTQTQQFSVPTLCPAGGCPQVRYETVGENYVFNVDGEVQQVPVASRASTDETAHGWGASSTPLTGQHACLCGGVDIEGDPTGRREAVSMVPIAVDATDVLGPTLDVAQGIRDRRRGTSTSPQTDPTTGMRIPGRTPEAPRVPPAAEIHARQAGLYTADVAPRLDRAFREADPAIMVAIHATADLPAGAERSARLQRLLDWAERRPNLPETVQEGATFGRGGTGSVAEVVGRPDLASKTGAGRAATEAAAMVELELAGIPTVYLGERPVEGGATRLVLRRIDGVGSKDIIGRSAQPPADPALAREYSQYVTPRTISDLEAIYTRLGEAHLNVGDFQFIIRRSDGAVFLNDPTGVTPNSGPSGNIRGIIDRFAAIVRRRTREGTTP
jgi:uncharacterized protein DUF4157